MATVELTFTALPVHVRTARLIVTAVARRSGVEESLLDEVRLAVGEACSQAVEAHQRNCPEEPVRLLLIADGSRFEVVVTGQSADLPGERSMDQNQIPERSLGAGSGQPAEHVLAAPLGGGALEPARQDDLAAGLGLAVIAGLADDVDFAPAGSGLRIRMSWPTAEARQRTG